MKDLDPQQKFLALITVLGGILVLGSYALIPGYSPEVRAGLWGGVPDSLRPLYGISMLLAAVGFLAFTYQLIFRRSPDEFEALIGKPYAVLFAVYALVYIPSSMWTPLTAAMLQTPASGFWVLIRADLALVALGSTLLLAILARLAVRGGGKLAWISVAGAIPFWFQTAILDAVVWPYYFPFP